MRREMLRTLEQLGPFKDAAEANRAFDAAFGVDAPAIRDLEKEVLSDLDETSFGVAWWVDALPPAARANIADYLLESLQGVQTALAEAALHLAELQSAADDDSKRFRRVVDANGVVKLPQIQNAAELVSERRGGLHRSGFFRAVGSALDLFAAVVVGVLAIPCFIVKSDFGQVRNWLATSKQRHRIHDDFKTKLDSVLSSAGPPGWVDWLAAYGNMLVHRAKRADAQFLTAEACIIDPNGRPVPRVEPVEVLVREPGLTNIQALRNARRGRDARLHQELFLTEDSRTTLTEALRAITFAIQSLMPALADTWRTRRASPGDPPQPAAQWKELSQPIGFPGFSAGTVNIEANQIVMGGAWDRRLRASGVLDSVRSRARRNGTG